MSQKNNFSDFFSGFNFMMPESSSLFPSSDFNEVFNSGMKFFEEASQISKDFMMKGFDSSSFFSLFQNSAEIINSSYSGYLEMFGFITKEAYDQLVEKYNTIQDEIDKQKKQISQKDSKIKDQEKKLKSVEKDMKDFEKKIKDLENELAAEKINKTALKTTEPTQKDVPK
jgi:septal ring factor EnvC (AmiA/AmiB activator)